jgi:hypothetical protein
MVGTFQTANYWFLTDSHQTSLLFMDPVEICEEELDLRLMNSGKVPTLRGAPVASWVLARLAALTGETLGSGQGEMQHNDGGDYNLEILVYRQDRTPVGQVQLQGGRGGVAALGECAATESPARIVEEFIAALLHEPKAVAPCQLRVRNLDTGKWRVFGYDDNKYLGRGRRGR